MSVSLPAACRGPQGRPSGRQQVHHRLAGRAPSGGSVFPGVIQSGLGEPRGWGAPVAPLCHQMVPPRGHPVRPRGSLGAGGRLQLLCFVRSCQVWLSALGLKRLVRGRSLAPPERSPHSRVCCWLCSPSTPAMSAGRPRREDTAAVFLTFAACVSKQPFPREALPTSSARVCRLGLGEGAQASSRLEPGSAVTLSPGSWTQPLQPASSHSLPRRATSLSDHCPMSLWRWESGPAPACGPVGLSQPRP